MNAAPFGARLAAAMAARGPLCVGIDPHPALLDAWDLPRDAGGLERFALTAATTLGPGVAVLKPQSALFEAFGSAGIAVLERVLAAGRDAGALMLLDAKRGDIGSTMAAYAQAYLTGTSPLAADALTVSPYLGFGSLAPAVDAAVSSGRGVFVLCRTSNLQGGEVQLAHHPVSGMTVSASIAAAVAAANSGAQPLGSIGLVVGATVTDTGLPAGGFGPVNGPLLAPGIGAQGASPADLRRLFAGALDAVLPTVSRSILSAGPSPGRLRDAAARTVDAMTGVLRPGASPGGLG